MMVGSEGWAVCCVDDCCDDLISREKTVILIQNVLPIGVV